jgi:hypothetical protein
VDQRLFTAHPVTRLTPGVSVPVQTILRKCGQLRIPVHDATVQLRWCRSHRHPLGCAWSARW